MKLNQATDYAFRAVLYLSKLSPGEVVEARIIAEQEHIPMRFMLKILRMLTQAGIVESYRGGLYRRRFAGCNNKRRNRYYKLSEAGF